MDSVNSTGSANLKAPESSPYRRSTAQLRNPPDHVQQSTRMPRKKFVLCFDGTGNKFSGSDSDSNILKIYRMLDRNGEDQFHYYQPGIGTYVKTGSLTHTSRVARIKSWYAKSKDSAIGISFDQHVMGGYKFLMRYYTPGDDIYFFGFSRGAYTARFLAEMLDHVGLLSAGNEEMAIFAWKTFQKWQTRQERTDKERAEKRELLRFMYAFRETFSRPVRRIRFLGLFDTVNSVPRFENAWMQRSKFPYTARSSAKVIRHAVAIDERRAKFRQHLISQSRQASGDGQRRRRRHSRLHQLNPARQLDTDSSGSMKDASSSAHQMNGRSESATRYQPRRGSSAVPGNYRDRSETSRNRSARARSSLRPEMAEDRSARSPSQTSELVAQQARANAEDSDEEDEQDIREVWFAGCHADIGGGWPLHDDEDKSLSHIPLVWMIREAQRTGLRFDPLKLNALDCCIEELNELEGSGRSPHTASATDLPGIEIQSADPNDHTPNPPNTEKATSPDCRTRIHHLLHDAATKGKIHDVLQFHNGAPRLSVISWNLMEYLPFRRMDLRADGRWTSIAWPLPKGEVRDIPLDALVHHSVIRRMEHDPEYRPGNLICGGGGRGVRRAPPEMGIGAWRVVGERGDPVGEVLVREELNKVTKEELNKVTKEELKMDRPMLGRG